MTFRSKIKKFYVIESYHEIKAQHLVGYRVMRYKNGRAFSGADSRQSFALNKGQTVRLQGIGMFLSLNKDYVVKHYASHDQNVLLTFTFDPKHVTKGNLTDKETEFTVSEAVLTDFEVFNDPDEEVIADDESYHELPSLKEAEALAPELAKAAQEVYDDWVLDEEGYHHEVGSGGICHVIADKLLDVLGKHFNTRMTSISSNHEQHVYVVAQFIEGVVTIDIPHQLYETGGGFTWKKIPGVEFEKSDIVFDVIDADPNSFKQYADYED